MKTIATAAVFFALTATAWADELESKANANAATGSEPIVLSEVQMDEVTAGFHVSCSDVYMVGNGSTSSSQTFSPGSTITWEYKVTNTGIY